MQTGDPAPQDTRPKHSLVLPPATVAVLGLVVVALVVAFKYLPDSKAPEAPPAPAYPDLRPRVTELEQQLAAARTAPPPYPNLSDKVAALESTLGVLQGQLAEAQSAPAYVTLRNRIAVLESELEATRDALATARKGSVEAQLRIERDDLSGRSARLTREVTQLRDDRERMQKLLAATGQQLRQASAVKSTLGDRSAALASALDELHAARVALATARDEALQTSEALAALQRATNRAQAEAAADRARLDQLRNTNATLIQENQQLRSAPVRAGPPTPSATAAVAGTTHVVAAGDSLANLSQRYYGTATRWPEIYNANADLLGPTGTLRTGYVLRIP